MPLIVIMWVTTLAQSTVMGWLGRRSTATRAPWLRLSIISGRAPADPLISRPMSKPSVMPRRSWADAIRSVETLVARSTPVFLASSSRASFTSVTTTKRAPTWRATAAAMSPIGPAPVTSTSSPTSGNDSAVCTALPNGSKIAARSGFMSAGCRHTSLAVAAVSADHMPLTGDHVTDSDRVHLGAYLHDVADELVSRNQGSVDGAGGPAVPGLDVQIGAADARAGDANLDVVGACGRFGTFGQRETRSRSCLVESLHRAASISANAAFSIAVSAFHSAMRACCRGVWRLKYHAPPRSTNQIGATNSPGRVSAYWANATIMRTKKTRTTYGMNREPGSLNVELA